MLLELSGSVTVTGHEQKKIETLHISDPQLNTIALDSNDKKRPATFFSTFGSFDHLIITLSGAKGGGTFQNFLG